MLLWNHSVIPSHRWRKKQKKKKRRSLPYCSRGHLHCIFHICAVLSVSDSDRNFLVVLPSPSPLSNSKNSAAAAPTDNSKQQEPACGDPSRDWMFSARCSTPKVCLQNAELEVDCINFYFFLVSSKFMGEKKQLQICYQYQGIGEVPFALPLLESLSSELTACSPLTSRSALAAFHTHLAEVWIREIRGSRESALCSCVSIYLSLPLWRQLFACYRMKMVC